MRRRVRQGGLAEIVFFGILVLLALTVRLVHVPIFAASTPFFDPAPWNTPSNPMDPGEYDRWARQIVGGDPWWTDHGQGEYFQSPVYPYFVAGLYLVLGGRSVLGVVLVQCVLGALGAGLVGLLARRLISPVAGWLAGIVAGLYGPAIFYESFLLKEPLAAFLVTAALWLTYAEFGPGGRLAHGRSRWPAWLVVGLVWGAALAAWPLLAPVAGCGCLWSVWRVHRRAILEGPTPAGVPAGQSAALAAGLLICGVFLAILPCTVRNVVGEGRFVLVSDAGPRNWDVGNSVNSTGTYIDFPRERLSAGTSAFWRLYARKLGLFARGDELPQVTDHRLLRDASPVLRLPLPAFGFVLPFAIAGLILGRRRLADLFPLYALAVLYPLLVALFFVVGRFRLPVSPALIFFAALAAESLRGAVRGLRVGAIREVPVAVTVTAVLLLAFLVNAERPLPPGAYPFHHAFARYHLELGEVAVRSGGAGEAMEAYDRVLQVPSRRYRAMAHTGRAGVYLGLMDRPDRALEEMRRSLEVDPNQREADRAREVIRRLEEKVDSDRPS
jgi:hypothetical protein